MDTKKFLEQCAPRLAWEPKDLNGAGATGDGVSLRHYRRCVFLLLMGDGTAGKDVTLTVEQMTDVANSQSDNKAVNCLQTGTIYKMAGADYTAYSALTAFSKITQATADEQYADTANGEVVGITALEIRADDLDIENGFDCIRVSASDPTASKICAGLYILFDPYYPDAPESMKDPLVD